MNDYAYTWVDIKYLYVIHWPIPNIGLITNILETESKYRYYAYKAYITLAHTRSTAIFILFKVYEIKI